MKTKTIELVEAHYFNPEINKTFLIRFWLDSDTIEQASGEVWYHARKIMRLAHNFEAVDGWEVLDGPILSERWSHDTLRTVS